jgi:hypothetical protein
LAKWTNAFHESFSKKSLNVTQLEIWKSIYERKKIGMHKLQLWDESSKANLQLIKLLVDSMFLALDRRLNESFNRYEKIYTFFSATKLRFHNKSSLRPELDLFKFESHSPQPGEIEAHSRSFFDFVFCFEEKLGELQERVNQFKADIHSSINQKILAERVKGREQSIKQMFGEIKTLKRKLQKISLLTSNKLANLTKAFKEYFVDANRTKRPHINVFEFVFSFINHVRDLSEMIREYGNLFVRLYEESKALERDRLEAMGESFTFYIEQIRRTFHPDLVASLDPAFGLLGKVDHNALIENSYDIDKMLSPEHHELIQTTLGFPATDIRVISDFIQKTKYEENIKEIFEYFVLKYYAAEDVNPKNNQKNKPKDVRLFLTIDYFYTIYGMNEETGEQELLARMPIEETDLTFSEGNIVHLVFYERNFLWKSKRKFSVRVQNDFLEEIALDHETFSILLRPEPDHSDSQSTKVLNKSLDDAREKDSRGHSLDTSPEKAFMEDSKIEQNINKLLQNGNPKFPAGLKPILEEKDEEHFTDERSVDVESRFSNDDLHSARGRSVRSFHSKRSKEV